MKKLLNILKKQSLTFKVISGSNIEHVASISTVIKVLKEIQQSYENFIRIEFLKNREFRKVFERNTKVLDTFMKSTELLLVDAKIDALRMSLAPDIVEKNNPIFTDEILEWKAQRFKDYKNNVFYANWRDLSFKQATAERYNAVERGLIFRPIIRAADTDLYKINAIIPYNNRIVRILPQLNDQEKTFYIPKPQKKHKKIEKYIHGYFRVSTREGENLKRNSIKEILDYEYLDHPTYPLKLDIIRANEEIIVLKQPIKAEVNFKDELYYIYNNEFDIQVKGETREEAEDAFTTRFYELYNTYHLADDLVNKQLDELVGKAKKLQVQKKLNEYIKQVITDKN